MPHIRSNLTSRGIIEGSIEGSPPEK